MNSALRTIGTLCLAVLAAGSLVLAPSARAAADLKAFGDSSATASTGITVTAGGPFLFTSGGGAGNVPGGTKAQALAYFASLDKTLQSYGYSLANVAFVHAALVPDATGKIDVDGWNAAWAEVFGTAKFPWKPAQTTIVIPKLWSVGPTVGEIDCICVAGSSDTMMSASKALKFPVTNPNLAPFETRKGRFYSAMGVAPGTSLFWTSGAGAPVANKDADPASRAYRGDIHVQAEGILKLIQANLATVGLTFKDVAFMRAYIGPDSFQGGKFDFDGWNEAYDKFFNNAENPHKPARTSISIAGFGSPTAMLEVEAIAAFPSEPAVFAAPDVGNANLKTYGKPEAAIASGVAVKGSSTYYFSSGVGPSVGGDLKTQALSALETLKTRLEGAGYGFKDVVFLHAFVVGDKDGNIDRKSWGEAYGTYFGTPAQPHKPARTTVAISGLANPAWKIELEVVAAKP
jgi:enamine deaminase RidA (YjgF/YER057c/UK114 family)